MSGLCGWFSRDPGALPIELMAAPLCRFDQAPARTASHGAGAVAVAGGLDRVGLYHEEGVLIAHWGERVDALARLWRVHGAKACAALSGQFAFAIVDERRGEALLAVDRCATRPLYYQLMGRTLVFATSADALALHPGAGRELDPQSLYNYLHLHAAPGPATMYRGQRRLAPGEFVHLQHGRLERGRYWRLRFNEHEAAGLPQLRAELLETVTNAVEASLGQQRVGVMLSGGAGSAALAALLQRVGDRQAPTCAVGAGPASRGVLAAARRIARELRTEHHERALGPVEAADAIPQLAAAFDQPCGDPDALAVFYGVQLAREAGVQRLLGGQGSAILFGRRAAYAEQLRLSRYERLPSGLRQLLLEPLLFWVASRVRGGPVAAARAHIEQSLLPMPVRLRGANPLHDYGPASVLEPDFLALVDVGAPQAMREQTWWLAQCRDPLNRLIALDLQCGLADRALPMLARAGEPAGIDIALPYLADGVVAFAARLQPRHKLGGDGRFALLRSAMRGTILGRTGRCVQAGLALPFAQWLQADARLKELAFDSLAGLRRRRIVRADFIDTLLAARLPEKPAHHGAMVWLLMMLEQWFAQRRVDCENLGKARTRPGAIELNGG
jgi:asparagine synthase (glutamine-hydrolysing)